MRHQAGDEVVALLREPEPARVVGRIDVEEVALAVPQAHVHVAAVAGQVRERLRHERRDQPALLRERLDHVAEEDRAVARDERVVEGEVLLELAVRVLVVGRVVVPAERRDVPRDVRDEAERARQRAHVVAGLVEVVERVGELDPAVLALAHEEVLQLAAHLERVAQLGGARELVAQDRARAERPRLALDCDVAGEARDLRLPRQVGQRRRVRHRRDVGIVRSLADVAGREARESGAVGEQPVQVRHRHQLGVRLAVHVDELGEDELDAAFVELGAELVRGGRRLDGHGDPDIAALRGRPAMASVTGPAGIRVCDVHIGTSDEAVTLRAVISTVFSTLEIDEVLAGVVDIATEATGCHACLIYLVESDRLLLRAASPVHSKFVGQIEMELGEGVTGWVAREKQAALIRDSALHDPRMKYFPELEEERWQSMAAVPVTSRAGDVIGVIVLHTAAPREFTEEDVELLTHTATLVGGAIEDAQLYEEARERVAALTQLAEVSQQLAAATRHERLHAAATAGARALLHADLCQLFRLEPGGSELRLAASDPPQAPGPRPQGGALLLELLARGRHGGSSRDLWPDHEGAALLTTPVVASDEQLGLLCVLRPRRFGAGDEELLRALADQTAMGLERAELIARLTARDRVKDMFDALAERAGDERGAGRRAAGLRPRAPARLPPRRAGGRHERRLGRRRHAARRAPARAATRPASSTPAATACARSCCCPARRAPPSRVIEACDAVAAAEHVVLGVSGPGRGIAESRQALREAQRAAQIALTLKPDGGALGYEQLGAYKYLVDLRLEESPRDRHWTAVEALLAHDRQRRTALLDTLEEYLARRRSVADTARTLYIHPNTLRQRLARIERVTELKLDGEDLLALELAVKLVRLDDARRRAGA